jgi:hypothetical protein
VRPYYPSMSISVELERVQSEAALRGPGSFLLTVTDDGRPHVVAVSVGWEGSALVLSAGRTSVHNAGARPGVSLLWPPVEPGGYSLIVDGEAVAEPSPDGEGGRVTLEVTRAVLHRPATSNAATTDATPTEACGSDCIPLIRRR